MVFTIYFTFFCFFIRSQTSKYVDKLNLKYCTFTKMSTAQMWAKIQFRYINVFYFQTEES